MEELERNLAENDSCKEEERSADDTGNNLGEVRGILKALEADEEIDNLGEEEVAIIKEIAEVFKRKTSYQLLEMYHKRSSYKKLLRLIKFWVSLKHTALQRLMNYFMLQLLLLQISREYRLVSQERERNQCGGGGYKIRLKCCGRT